MFEIAIGVAVVLVFNISVLFYKVYKRRYLDLCFDISVLAFLTMVFGGSTLALVSANIASLLMSIILYFIPMDKLFPFMKTLRGYFSSTPSTRRKRRFC